MSLQGSKVICHVTVLGKVLCFFVVHVLTEMVVLAVECLAGLAAHQRDLEEWYRDTCYAHTYTYIPHVCSHAEHIMVCLALCVW